MITMCGIGVIIDVVEGGLHEFAHISHTQGRTRTARKWHIECEQMTHGRHIHEIGEYCIVVVVSKSERFIV